MREPMPEIAVLLPAYNAEDFIQRAVNSLNSSTERHDIIVVDDGSKNSVADFIMPQDNLVILRLDQNSGISTALNHGLEYVLQKGYKYIARLDADDLVIPERLERQKNFLEKHPEVDLVGSWARIVDESGMPHYYFNMPVSHEAIKKEMYYQNCMFHPSLMFRSEIIGTGIRYNSSFDGAEDWDFIRRIMRNSRVANIPEYLIDYTITLTGICQSRPIKHMFRDFRVQLAHAHWFSIHYYLGIIKTGVVSVRMLSKSHKRHKISEEQEADLSALPVYVRDPYKGMKEIGKIPD